MALKTSGIPISVGLGVVSFGLSCFKTPDGSLVAVICNSGAARTMTVAGGGKKLQFGMPANGWATANAQ